MQIEKVDFPNVGFLKCKVDDLDLLPLNNEISEIYSDFSKGDSFATGLAGHLKQQYRLYKSKEHLQNLILPTVYKFKETFPNHDYRGETYKLENSWVNFQHKWEFNPPHFHLGEFSFALWVRIPYDIEEERKVFPEIKKEENLVGSFSFQYIDTLGLIQRYRIECSKEHENTLLVFPAKMFHFVSPFYTTDEYRITVSGNFSAC